jgi:mono/diheme cytochrome c family protein
MTKVGRSSIILALASFILVGAAAFRGWTPAQASQSVPSTVSRVVKMLYHFSDVMSVHEAVIRGELAAVRAPALRVAVVTMPAGMPPRAEVFVADIRAAGQRADDAKTFEAAARATVDMVSGCANCHRSVGVFPSPAMIAPRDIGGIVGHMQQHQLAVDNMLLGLMIPSPSTWRDGADRLLVAPLLPSKYPDDVNLTNQIRKADARVHDLARQAVNTESPTEQANVYTQVIANCAQCHTLHSRVWGPGRGGLRP